MAVRRGDDAVDIEMFVVSVDEPTVQCVFAPAGHPHAEPEIERVSVDPGDAMLLPRQGTGTWPNGERAVRIGSAEEILITLPTNPFVALSVARDCEVFTLPIRRLVVDVASVEVRDTEISWDATLRTAPWRKRSASLRMYASPSLNVTVITLVPTRASKLVQRSFVRHGLRTTRELGRRIEERAASNVAVECPT